MVFCYCYSTAIADTYAAIPGSRCCCCCCCCGWDCCRCKGGGGGGGDGANIDNNVNRRHAKSWLSRERAQQQSTSSSSQRRCFCQLRQSIASSLASPFALGLMEAMPWFHYIRPHVRPSSARQPQLQNLGLRHCATAVPSLHI